MLWSKTFIGCWLRSRYARRWKRISSIPDEAALWRAIKPDLLYRDGSIKPAFFRDRRGGYSCDIAAFSNREQSRRGYADPPAWNPDEAGLVEFTVGNVRRVNTDVEHAPIRTEHTMNYSHAQFTRQLTGEEEVLMAKTAVVVIAPKPRR